MEENNSKWNNIELISKLYKHLMQLFIRNQTAQSKNGQKT